MYRNYPRYLATEKDRQVYWQWLLGCAIVYGLPLLYLAAIAMFTGSTNAPHRNAEQVSIAGTVGHSSVLKP